MYIMLNRIAKSTTIDGEHRTSMVCVSRGLGGPMYGKPRPYQLLCTDWHSRHQYL